MKEFCFMLRGCIIFICSIISNQRSQLCGRYFSARSAVHKIIRASRLAGIAVCNFSNRVAGISNSLNSRLSSSTGNHRHNLHTSNISSRSSHHISNTSSPCNRRECTINNLMGMARRLHRKKVRRRESFFSFVWWCSCLQLQQSG